MSAFHNSEASFEKCPHDSEHPFVMISRKMAQDKSISPKAKGVLLYLLSLPSNWKIYHSQLQDGLGIGEESLNSALEELIREGYADRTRERVKGIFQPYKYKIREFKKCSPDRVFQPGSPGPENPVLHIDIESKHIEKKQQQSYIAPVSDAAVFSKYVKKEEIPPNIHPLLERIDIPIADKVEITQMYNTERIQHALRWLERNERPLTKGMAAALKWACKTMPEIPETKKDIELVNKAYALLYDGIQQGIATVEVSSKYVEIRIPGPYENFNLRFDENGFREQFTNALRKNNFKVLGDP